MLFLYELFHIYPIFYFLWSVGTMETVETETAAHAVPVWVVVPVERVPTVMYNCLGVYRVSAETSLVALSEPGRYSVECIVSAEPAASFALRVADMPLCCPGQVALLLQTLYLAEGGQ